MRPINIISAVTFIFCCAAGLSHISAQSSEVNGNSHELTNQQSIKVKSILSHYGKPLNSDDARAITNSFRSIGLQMGPALEIVIKQAGFDPELLYKLVKKQNPKPF